MCKCERVEALFHTYLFIDQTNNNEIGGGSHAHIL